MRRRLALFPHEAPPQDIVPSCPPAGHEDVHVGMPGWFGCAHNILWSHKPAISRRSDLNCLSMSGNRRHLPLNAKSARRRVFQSSAAHCCLRLCLQASYRLAACGSGQKVWNVSLQTSRIMGQPLRAVLAWESCYLSESSQVRSHAAPPAPFCTTCRLAELSGLYARHVVPCPVGSLSIYCFLTGTRY